MKKILILLANPQNTDKLRLDQEVRGIQDSLQRSKNREQFEIVTEWAVQVDDLRRALLTYQPTIVHFSGHGSQGQGLVLENNLGQMQVISTESLARLFKLFQNHVECVLLNACYSEDQAEAIHQHIDYVIGMNRAIGDKAAIEFAVGFYDALGAGRTYEDCFEVGCASVDLKGIPESQTPAIKARKRSSSETRTNKENTTPVEPVNSEPVNSGSITQTAGDNAILFGNITQAGNLNIQK
ncbi:MAG: CHAT domain-containing protein [Scytonematopsis contorta HA4267-MV1]|jgi:hypothetical protein|nr:CHAT domain-containing protein [Scytonematopsis contorta HA4267-MV1]